MSGPWLIPPAICQRHLNRTRRSGRSSGGRGRYGHGHRRQRQVHVARRSAEAAAFGLADRAHGDHVDAGMHEGGGHGVVARIPGHQCAADALTVEPRRVLRIDRA